jgi:hypothetical protein
MEWLFTLLFNPFLPHTLNMVAVCVWFLIIALPVLAIYEAYKNH